MEGGGEGSSRRRWVEVVGEAVSTALPVWVALSCAVGLARPGWFWWLEPGWMVTGIMVTMLGMGKTLTFDDLRGALAMPKELAAGFLLHYSIMPLSGYFVSKHLGLPSYYAAGLILVVWCPRVLVTAASTLASVVMTPFLTARLAGQFVAVDAAGLFKSTLQVLLLPVLAGAFLNQYFQGLVKFVSPFMPPVAIATVAVLCGNAIAQNASAIMMSGLQVMLSAVLLHAFGFSLGYLLARMLGIDVVFSRTISIEVGMENSVLGVVIARQHYGNPLTAVPCAVSSICHSIFGSVSAGNWRQSVPSKMQDSKVQT
ncbi:hypothetical protein NMG60_11003250 [Bertholletia excelsa]